VSRKHYAAIAAVFREHIGRAADAAEESAIEMTARSMCPIFASDNPRFCRSKFLAACGIEP
jgi:hypothetical protein